MNRVNFDFTGANVLVTGGTSGIGHGDRCRVRQGGAAVTVTGTRDPPLTTPIGTGCVLLPPVPDSRPRLR